MRNPDQLATMSGDPLPPRFHDEDPWLTASGRDFLTRLLLDNRIGDYRIPSGNAAAYPPTAEENARIDRLIAEGAFRQVFSGFTTVDKLATAC